MGWHSRIIEGGVTVTSRKRWDQVYTRENPFRLPQSLMRTLKRCTRAIGCRYPDTVKYLWIHLSSEPFVPQQLRRDDSEHRELSLEDWLNVIDESAALGAENLIISVGTPLSQKPMVYELAQWAQATYGMVVGLYVCGARITPEDLPDLTSLDLEKTRLFVDSSEMEHCGYLRDAGLQICEADGLHPGEVSPPCHLPETMTCVGAEGTLYTCGLVLGQDHYRLGDVLRKRLDGVMTDENLPHMIPGGISEGPRRCNACPPLMERRMRGLSGH